MSIQPFSFSNEISFTLKPVEFEWNRHSVRLIARIYCTGTDDGRNWFETDVEIFLDGERVDTSSRDEEDDKCWNVMGFAHVHLDRVGYDDVDQEFIEELEYHLMRHLGMDVTPVPSQVIDHGNGLKSQPFKRC